MRLSTKPTVNRRGRETRGYSGTAMMTSSVLKLTRPYSQTHTDGVVIPMLTILPDGIHLINSNPCLAVSLDGQAPL